VRIKRWIWRVVIVLVAGFVATYLGDLAVYRLRGSPTSTVSVSKFMSVPLKGNKIEYDYVGTADEPCSVSLFPRDGQSACWRLRRNPNQTTTF
jgi:alkylated DNA nucleotide flippase Atl1